MFEMAGGSIIGRDHQRTFKNNQDSLVMVFDEDFSIVVVTDGCGESKFSEAGAQIGAKLIAQVLAESTKLELSIFGEETLADPEFFERVRLSVLDRLQDLASRMGENFSQVVNDYFLFTVVGVLLTKHVMVFFHLGDGVIIVNGELTKLGPYPDNTPPYLGYGLVLTSLPLEALQFQIGPVLSTQDVQSFLIGTDGVADLIAASGRKIPGKQELIGPVSQFWETDRYFQNPYALTSYLRLVNNEKLKANWEEQKIEREIGPLLDDTTLIVGRLCDGHGLRSGKFG